MTGQKHTLRMGKLAGVLGASVFFAAVAPLAHASTLDLYDFALSTSNGTSGDWQDLAATDPFSIIDGTSTLTETPSMPGTCCGDASGGTTPGIGTVNYTFSPGAAGTYTVNLYFDYDVSVPDYNEYGIYNPDAGTAETGVTGEIFNANASPNDIVLYGACGSANCETYGNSTDGRNEIPGTASNDPYGCTGASCNGDVGMALTFTFTTTSASEYAVITAVSSTTDPTGWSLETIHPVDALNTSQSQVYLTGSYTLEGSGSTPEPSTWVLLASALVLFGIRGIRRKARV